MRKPVVAIVGRPNVGKSTLYNRLAGERLAVVDDVPGTTRDRLITEVEWAGVVFDIIDTGGIDPSEVKIGEGREPLSVGSADFIEQIRTQAEIAIRDADAILFITDVDSGITPADKEVSQILRKSQKQLADNLRPPIFLVVNKCDNEIRRNQALEFYELGVGEPHPISALHGTGIGDLLDHLVETFSDYPPEGDDDESVKIAIVGKPNVGKSSLLNRLLGEERSIVSPIPGTTRDAIDTYIEFEGIPITLIDTAGIRKRGQVDPGVEKFSVIRSFKAIQRADVAVLLIDATVGMTAQDAHIAGWIIDAWKSVVVAVNKWDAIEKDTYTIEEYKQDVRHHLNFMDYVPILFISAKTGQRVDRVLPIALQVQEERLVRLATSQVNQIIRKAVDRHPPPSKGGRHLKIYYGTQVRSDPPTFLLYVNNPQLAHFTYVRYLKNIIRESYNFLGTPIRIVLKPRS